jgi:hypothetical protein
MLPAYAVRKSKAGKMPALRAPNDERGAEGSRRGPLVESVAGAAKDVAHFVPHQLFDAGAGRG